MVRIPTQEDLLITRLRQRAIDVVGSVIPRERPVALLDFPRHSNVGDSAIWLGEIDCLAASGVRLHDIRYMCDVSTYEEAALRNAIGEEGVILLHGGGNFGDLWNSHQRFREAVVAAFPKNAIVLLPQTIHYEDRKNLDRTARVFNAHGDLTILVRDHESLHVVQRDFRAVAHLCPDLAFCLGRLPRPVQADRPVLYLARRDMESPLQIEHAGDSSVAPCDWPGVEAAWKWQLGDVIARFGLDHPRLRRGLPAALSEMARRRAYNSMARERLRTGCELLAHGRVIITDRLHAHILSLLMGVPNVILDNSYGKLRRFHDAWTSSFSLTHFAQTPTEAFAIAREIRP